MPTVVLAAVLGLTPAAPAAAADPAAMAALLAGKKAPPAASVASGADAAASAAAAASTPASTVSAKQALSTVDDRLITTWSLVRDRLVRLLGLLPLLLVAGLVIWGASWLGRWVAARPRLFGWESANPYLQGVVQRLVQLAILLAGVLVALDLLGATALVGAVLGSAGVVGIVIGFAFRDVAENYLAGVLLSLRRPFAPGDLIQVGNREGRVIALNARATILMTPDGNHLRLPNSMVFKEVLLNYTRNPRRRFRFEVELDARMPLDHAQAVGVATLTSMDGVLDDPEPTALVLSASADVATIEFYGWIDQRQTHHGRMRSEAIRMVRAALAAEGLGPLQQITRVQLLAEGKDAPPPAPRAPGRQADVSHDDELADQIDEARARQADSENLLVQGKENG